MKISSCGPVAKGTGVKPPRVIHSPDPKYTAEARKNHIQGVVVLQAVVCADGTAQNIVVKRPLGYGLDEEAGAVLRTWRVRTATRDKSAVPVRIMIEVNFGL